MALVKWEPLREFEDMFDRYSKAMGWPHTRGREMTSSGDWSPYVDISETDDEFDIKAELPEVKKGDVKISLENGVLTIQGDRKQEKEVNGRKYHRVERSYGSFLRSFTLPENIDSNKVKASFKDGLLDIHIPKTAQAKTRAIEVKVE